MTFRAVVLGILGAAVIAAVGYLNDSVLQLSYLVGNHFPISVFGILILVALCNPLLAKLRARWRFRPSELAVIVCLTLVACSIPGSGLMRSFYASITVPIEFNRKRVGWRKNEVLTYAPSSMMPAGGKYDNEVMNGYLNGLGEEGNPIGLDKVPWAKWQEPLTTWMPIIILTAIAVVCMSLIVHRQWALRERLRYPIADFAMELMSEGPDAGIAPIFKNKLFWTGLVVLLVIHFFNGLDAWIAGQETYFPFFVNLTAIAQKWPAVAKETNGGFLLRLAIYPTVVAFGFMLASDVSLSLGLSQLLLVPLIQLFLVFGIDMKSEPLTGGLLGWQMFGSHVAVAGMLVYTGRRYYWQVVKQAFTFFPQAGTERSTVWACRLMVLAMAAMTWLFMRLGLEWMFAVGMVFLIMIMFLVVARMNAESGLFFCRPFWQPLAVFLGLFGAAALGPKALVIIGLLCVVLTIDPRECLMPFIVNGMKMCEDVKVRPSRLGWSSVGIYIMALAIATPVVLWANYNFGYPQWDRRGTKKVPKFTFDAADRTITKLKLADQLEESVNMGWVDRIKNMQPDKTFLWSAGIGIAVVLVFSILRLRFVWWPLHPVIFLAWGTFPMKCFSHSFLLGWVLKTLVTKLAGGQKYRQVRMLMFGVIAGDLLGGLLWMVVGAVYYAVTGFTAKPYRVFPF